MSKIKLFASLYLDEDISIKIMNSLKNRGFDITCARDEQMLEKSDTKQL